MTRKQRSNRQQTPAPTEQPAVRQPAWSVHRYGGKSLLLLLSIAMLTLAYAPVGQFYLAWLGLLPWLFVIRQCRSIRTAFFWSWAAGTVFFTANMWWMAGVTFAGMQALMVYLGLYWGLAAWVIRGARLLDLDRPAVFSIAVPLTADPPVLPSISQRRWRTLAGTLAIATIWVAFEWVRGNLMTGLPWLYLGHTQSPILVFCQIADIFGVYGISFWVASIGALAAIWLLNGRKTSDLAFAGPTLLGMSLAIAGYGVYRMSQQTTSPGPRVMVVQCNYPQDNSGSKGATPKEIVDFHLNTTAQTLQQDGRADLVIWSETMMPPLNAEAFDAVRPMRHKLQVDWEFTHERISGLAKQYHVAILAGGTAYLDWRDDPVKKGYIIAMDRRNRAYFYNAQGQLQPEYYDKIHLVPFGEFMPLKDTPVIGSILLSFSPYKDEYILRPGPANALTVFPLPPRAAPTTSPAATAPVATAPVAAPAYRLVVPICFEDIDAPLVARMFRPAHAGQPKRADIIINMTNDGWFLANENSQHLQAAIFRSIENRAPTARSVNTGISGFIDSLGHTYGLLPARTAGAITEPLTIDSRLTFYTLYGDVFGIACTTLAAAVALASYVRRFRKRRQPH